MIYIIEYIVLYIAHICAVYIHDIFWNFMFALSDYALLSAGMVRKTQQSGKKPSYIIKNSHFCTSESAEIYNMS